MRARHAMLSALALVLAAVLAACTSTGPTGSLQVTVSGLPAGVDANVTVAGPGGYTASVTGTTTLTVAPGSYSVTAATASDGNAIVPALYAGSASPSTVTVTANTTSSAAAGYALRVGSGHLWLSMWSAGLEVAAYPGSSLAASGTPGPDVTFVGGPNTAEAVAIDGAGNLWVVDQRGYITRYDAAQLGASGTPTPAVTIDATAYYRLYGAAFDAAGDLWVAAFDGNELLMVAPSQLAAGGTLAPAVIVRAASGSLNGPISLAFDAAGNLWAANFHGQSLVSYTPAQLAAGGSPVPAVTLTSAASGGIYPEGIAFDADGNLWAADDAGTVVRFDAGQLASSGSRTPAATIDGTAGATPSSVAFDAGGALWVFNTDNISASADLRRFTDPGALSGVVMPTPDVIVSSVGKADAAGMAFDPPPAGLPINTP